MEKYPTDCKQVDGDKPLTATRHDPGISRGSNWISENKRTSKRVVALQFWVNAGTSTRRV